MLLQRLALRPGYRATALGVDFSFSFIYFPSLYSASAPLSLSPFIFLSFQGLSTTSSPFSKQPLSLFLPVLFEGERDGLVVINMNISIIRTSKV